MFADNQGRVHVFEGKVAQGSAEFTDRAVDPTERGSEPNQSGRLAENKVNSHGKNRPTAGHLDDGVQRTYLLKITNGQIPQVVSFGRRHF